jgi:hypothetical protein
MITLLLIIAGLVIAMPFKEYLRAGLVILALLVLYVAWIAIRFAIADIIAAFNH